MRETLYDYCVRSGETQLLKQWEEELNYPLDVHGVYRGSKQKAWWRCEHGHLWKTSVFIRTGGSGCPYCTGKLPFPGQTDLASKFPDLAAQWHPVKNGSLTPEQVLPGSHRKVWWICEKGHEWQAIVKSRVSGSGCPVCADRMLLPGQNDLETTMPELAAQWHPTKNGALRPCDLVAGTRRRVWWRCEKGHEWQAAVSSRASGTGCPVCAGRQIIAGFNDLASLFPSLAAEWCREKNGLLTPESVPACSNRKVWWRCARGHTYAAVIASRTTSGSGCPYCSGRKVLAGFNDLATTQPKIAGQWHPTLNGGMTPEMVTAGSRRRVWWICAEGHVWKAAVYSRTGTQKCGCPVCAGKVRRSRLHHYEAEQVQIPVSRGHGRV